MGEVPNAVLMRDTEVVRRTRTNEPAQMKAVTGVRRENLMRPPAGRCHRPSISQVRLSVLTED
jgi:hypothetical protein